MAIYRHMIVPTIDTVERFVFHIKFEFRNQIKSNGKKEMISTSRLESGYDYARAYVSE